MHPPKGVPVHVSVVEEKDRIIGRRSYILKIATVVTGLAPDLAVRTRVKAPGHHFHASCRALLHTLIPIIPERIQVGTFPEIVRVVGVRRRPEAKHRCLGPGGIWSSQHPSLRSCVGGADRLTSCVLVITHAEVARNRPVLEGSVDHLAVRSSPRCTAKVFVREHRGLRQRRVPVRNSQNCRVHTQQGILELQNKSCVPSHEHGAEMRLVPPQVKHGNQMLCDEIVIRAK
mmetsp:Transcript_50256/g.114158  ORF Transcript_50256/g.114158 Transcript_50256/m.114158 type:complete len:230 (+) Transcript_50256:871-1560(+)